MSPNPLLLGRMTSSASKHKQAALRSPPLLAPDYLACYLPPYLATKASVTVWGIAMCQFFKRVYACSCVRYISMGWCEKYTRTEKRCTPEIVQKEEFEHDKVCGNCRPPNTSTA
ncbi:hypothetical protein B0T24DRAFT_639011 [Lasiosphaeria ovina]|uniref:Uncharacterized protein n=1 Tax=Lasiosphaeria ovina TaxID=92902 RepID=A0AAE0JWN8_9PEZI|nr:hypothetical protein B0T24DRAFT_639011 [Lasiosphaeria ovina]